MHKFTTVKQQQPNSLKNRLSKQIISDISRRLINLNRDAYFHVCVCDPLCRWLKCRWFFSTPSKLVDHDIRQNVCIRFFSLFSYVERNANTNRNGFNFYRHFYELHTWHFLAHLISIINVTTSKHIFYSCFCLRCLVKWNEQQKIKFIRNWISGWKIGRFGIWPRRGIQSNSPRKRINNADRALTKQIIWEIPLVFSSYVKSEFLLLNNKKEMLNC